MHALLRRFPSAFGLIVKLFRRNTVAEHSCDSYTECRCIVATLGILPKPIGRSHPKQSREPTQSSLFAPIGVAVRASLPCTAVHLRCTAVHLQCAASRLRRYKLGSLNYIRGSQRPPFTTVFHLRQNDHECVGSVAEVPPVLPWGVSLDCCGTTVEHSLAIAWIESRQYSLLLSAMLYSTLPNQP